jgi:hypothetical protein
MPKRKKKPLTLADMVNANKQGTAPKIPKPKKKRKRKTQSEIAREKLNKLSDADLKARAERAFKQTYMRLSRLKKEKNLSTAAKMHISEISGYITKKGTFSRATKGMTREKLIEKIIKAEKFSSYQTTTAAGNRRQFQKEAAQHGATEQQYSFYQQAWDWAKDHGLFDKFTPSEIREAIEYVVENREDIDNFSDFMKAVLEYLDGIAQNKNEDFDEVFGEEFDDEPFTNPDFFD